MKEMKEKCLTLALLVMFSMCFILMLAPEKPLVATSPLPFPVVPNGILQSGSEAWQVGVVSGVKGDLDADGDIDVLLADGNSQIWVLENEGGNTFEDPLMVATVTGYPVDIDWVEGRLYILGYVPGNYGWFGDPDSDPDQGIIQTAVWPFAGFTTLMSVDWARDLEFGDLNGDGTQDLLLSRSYDMRGIGDPRPEPEYVYSGDGAGGFTKVSEFLSSWDSYTLLSRISPDGDHVAICDNGPYEGGAHSFRNNGDWTFTLVPNAFGTDHVWCEGLSKFEDLSGDGEPDLVIESSFLGGTIALSNGDGTYSLNQTINGGAVQVGSTTIHFSEAMSFIPVKIDGNDSTDLIIVMGSCDTSFPELADLDGLCGHQVWLNSGTGWFFERQGRLGSGGGGIGFALPSSHGIGYHDFLGNDGAIIRLWANSGPAKNVYLPMVFGR